jgi:glycosyltransferase involved in cell wall biosynthesis
MRISVAIATYNRAAMVEAAIEAALAQSRPPQEIVVSDDASTDGTSAVLRRLSERDRRVRVFRQETNLGGARNANFAMRQTTGDFLAWCSDDDRFLPGHLEASVNFLEAHPGVGLVHSGFVDAVERGVQCSLAPRRLRADVPLLVRRDSLIPYLIRYYNWPFHPSTLILRRQVWERTGEFDEAYALCDTDWFVRAAEQFAIAMLPRLGVINRRHPGNWSNRLGSARMQREIFEIGERALLRRWPRRGPRRMLWRAAWRANVRLRLAWTLGLRLRTGYGNAACAAWHGMLQDTGRRAPGWMEESGARLIRRWCAGRAAELEDSSGSVIPL